MFRRLFSRFLYVKTCIFTYYVMLELCYGNAKWSNSNSNKVITNSNVTIWVEPRRFRIFDIVRIVYHKTEIRLGPVQRLLIRRSYRRFVLDKWFKTF